MNPYNEILEKMIALTNQMNKTRKTPRDFGVGFPLYQAEIHTVEAIGAHESIRADALAKVLGITNGAVTQMADKLVKKGLVEKFKADGNQKEVHLRLTQLGRTAERAHDAFHAQAYQAVTAYLGGLLSREREALTGFLDLYLANLPEE